MGERQGFFPGALPVPELRPQGTRWPRQKEGWGLAGDPREDAGCESQLSAPQCGVWVPSTLRQHADPQPLPMVPRWLSGVGQKGLGVCPHVRPQLGAVTS